MPTFVRLPKVENMKYLLFVSVCLMLSSLAFSQERQVVIRKGYPVIAYQLGPNETSYQAFKKFGMEEELFLLLNSSDENSDSAANSNSVWVWVNAVLLGQCLQNCTPLLYAPDASEDFKSIGKRFGNLNPYLIKQMNPDLEAVAPGTRVKVGYLSSHLWPVVNEEEADTAHAMVDTATVVAKPSANDSMGVKSTASLYTGIGYYAAEFQDSGTEKIAGKAANFKSFGGWYDGKFYVLLNGVELGKVVKITNPQNGLSIFAKVVSALPDLKTEKLLVARINNAGCAALDIWNDEAFEVEIKW